ncbi:hypothetical protein DFS34DRAFT_648828 [Phlyctochytrium arcticum]|nr:hypothetical protein DFS34DRAFT_648828 [Phlyctochytrium arcticum]
MPAPGTFRPPQAPTAVTIPKFTHSREGFAISPNHVFQLPVKRIHDEATMTQWGKSEAFVRIIEFIQVMNESVRGKTNSDPCTIGETVQKLLHMLDTLDRWIDEIPPLESPQRFGNKAFRNWCERLDAEAPNLIKDILPTDLHSAIPELVPYLTGGFGHATRIDYGSGHELSFVTWLCCLDLLGQIKPDDYQAVVTRVFERYLVVVRRLQRVYMLEPAGSHGVWGLDDHQFLPYLWGSAQLSDHPRLKPKSVLQADIVQHFGKEYLYLASIQYINEVKKGPFHEHSPILYDITGVPHWRKVNSGMLKMYVAEVLQKYPVIQHLPFGSLIPFVEVSSPSPSPSGM